MLIAVQPLGLGELRKMVLPGASGFSTAPGKCGGLAGLGGALGGVESEPYGRGKALEAVVRGSGQ